MNPNASQTPNAILPILFAFRVQDLLGELKRRGLDVRDLYHRLEELTVLTEERERDVDAPWSNEYREAEASLRAWDTAKRELEKVDSNHAVLSAVVAASIDLVHAVRFVTGRRPTEDERSSIDEGNRNGAKVWEMSCFVGRGDDGEGLHVRSFQRAGVSSSHVAHAVRRGFVNVVLAG